MGREGSGGVETAGMSAGKAAAIELTESAREELRAYATYAGSLFMGRARWPIVSPWPEEPEAERARGDAFLARLEAFLREHVDPGEIDRTGEIPEHVIEGLRELGAFGIKIPEAYGGLGHSQRTYSRCAILLGSWCGSTTALLSAHQSIGVPQPLLLYGTEAQKERFLPGLARGEVSAFALTEAAVGSDPAGMETTAVPSEDGRHYVINGEKIWCTNGTIASWLVVMARTSDVEGRRRFTAFVVDAKAPGVKVTYRCHFMGLRALFNAVVRFEDVEVPRENVIREVGKGLGVALSTLNTGRLTLPAGCVGLARRCLSVARTWARDRVQWGSPIGEHALIADRIAAMAADTFAMEAMTLLTSALVDGKEADIRLEAAMCKLWCSEAGWRIVDDLLQIRGGRGYETAASLGGRGEEPIPVEQWLRDARINTIFEGSSEILRLFIAREAVDPHLQAVGDLVRKRAGLGAKLRSLGRATLFYLAWYPRQWLPLGGPVPRMDRRLAPHARWVGRTSRRLARRLFHALLRHGPRIEERQLLLARFVDVGTELFAVSAALVRAQGLHERGEGGEEAIALAEAFARRARLRVETSLRGLGHNVDRTAEALARRVLAGEFAFLERGIVGNP